MFSKIIYVVSSFLEFVLEWKIDYMTIHIPHKKFRMGCIYCDADPVGVGVSVSTNVVCIINICTIYPDRITGFRPKIAWLQHLDMLKP